ncbi:Ly6/PLAUR domain-containing 11 [Apodemus speciosus]|uniref:Ly6/PLAUR domain-containing 11 n=1 Tax=Apodemus speciosus TaxID=105296 RepID=A0ABQ0EXS9_APOSI
MLSADQLFAASGKPWEPAASSMSCSSLGFSPCSDTLTCHKGIMVKLGTDFTKTAVEWKSFGTMEPEPNSICQETLLLVDVGTKSLLLASKGTSDPGSNNSLDVQVFSAGPGIVAASYAHFCVTDLCNNANSSSVLLDSLSLAVVGSMLPLALMDACPTLSQTY